MNVQLLIVLSNQEVVGSFVSPKNLRTLEFFTFFVFGFGQEFQPSLSMNCLNCKGRERNGRHINLKDWSSRLETPDQVQVLVVRKIRVVTGFTRVQVDT